MRLGRPWASSFCCKREKHRVVAGLMPMALRWCRRVVRRICTSWFIVLRSHICILEGQGGKSRHARPSQRYPAVRMAGLSATPWKSINKNHEEHQQNFCSPAGRIARLTFARYLIRTTRRRFVCLPQLDYPNLNNRQVVINLGPPGTPTLDSNPAGIFYESLEEVNGKTKLCTCDSLA